MYHDENGTLVTEGLTDCLIWEMTHLRPPDYVYENLLKEWGIPRVDLPDPAWAEIYEATDRRKDLYYPPPEEPKKKGILRTIIDYYIKEIKFHWSCIMTPPIKDLYHPVDKETFERLNSPPPFYTQAIAAWEKQQQYLAQPVDELFPATPLMFANGQPDCLFEEDGGIPFVGQDLIKKRIILHIKSMGADDRIKALLTGPAGTGKTTLARIMASLIQAHRREQGVEEGEYFELLPAQVSDKLMLDRFMTRIARSPGATIFIDEIHTLTRLEDFFHTLHDSGDPRFPLADGSWLDIPKNISWIGATTDPGQLDKTVGGAMRRRLEPELRLEPPTKQDLASIVCDQADNDGIYLSSWDATTIAERSLFPWQAKLIYEEARRIAKVGNLDEITETVLQEVYDMIGLDERGLLPEDRDVIAALFKAKYELASRPGVVKYRLSEDALCTMTGLDNVSYRKRVQAKLVRLGYLTTSGGQCLTEKAQQDYRHLDEDY